MKTETDWETSEGRQVKTEIRRAGQHQPDRETNEGRQVKTKIRRAGHHQPESHMKGYKCRQRFGEPDTTSETGRQIKGDK